MSDETPEPTITPEMIEHAEKLIGFEFTPSEREQMAQNLSNKVADYEKVRSHTIDNSIPPALYFDPRAILSQPLIDIEQREYNMSPQPDFERPDNLEDLAFAPVTQLAELIRTKKVTSVELTEMYLARLKRYNPYLECVVTFTEDLAMRKAKRADEELAQGIYRGPLQGIPYGAKDLLATKGIKTTWGAMPFKDQMIDIDATVVQRLEEAGAVLIAKLTLGALAYGDIWFDGKTRNPWNIEEGSSGSSAGSASATAAGCVGFSIGTETLGSIVSPATRCGTTGLRPTFGRVSRHGAMALVWSMDKIGPICRTVEDCGLVFNAIYGPDGHDTTIVDIPFNWQPAMDIRQLRIGYLESAFSTDPPESESILKSHDEAESAARENSENDVRVLDVLRSLDINLLPIELPDDDYSPLFLILMSEAAAAFEEITRTNQDDTMQWQDDDAWPNSFRAARFIPAVEFVNGNRLRTLLMQKMEALMKRVDVFVVPSFANQALVITNLTGHPAVVLPNGFTSKNTPTSITFIGKLDGEAEVLAVAKAYQDATDFHKQYPPMDY